MLTKNEEIDRVIGCCNNNRDKFNIALKWNTGARDAEIETLKWKQIYQDGDLIKIDLKTAKHSSDEDDRIIALIYALPYYHRWKQEYKERFNIPNDKDLEEMFIFRKLDSKKNERTSHAYYIKLFKEIGKKLNHENFTPKLFRKYAISRWQSSEIPESLIRKMSGHSKNSRAIEHYSFHDENECARQLLRIEGKISEEIKIPTDPEGRGIFIAFN